MGFMSELKRRNVFRMAALYLVSAWLIMQIAEVVIGLANLPDWIGPLILVLLAVGLPIALVLSWFYELTPEGITLDKDIAEAAAIRHARGRRIDLVVIAVLGAAVVLFAYDKWWPAEVLEKSIAVLAFENMSGDPGQEYLSDGIAEELLNALAKIPELHVTSRSSSFSFKNRNVPISEVAQQLNVSHVLEGSVRKSGERIRITAQLIDAASDKHLWSQTYDRELDDIFVVQDDIAGQICDALKVTLLSASGEKVAPAVLKSAELAAYDAYLKGREIVRLREPRRYQEAGELFLQALRIDPTFAPAHAQIVISLVMWAEHQDDEDIRWAEEIAAEHLGLAQALDPDFPELHAARALFAGAFENDQESAVVHAKRALELNPDYVDAMNWLRGAYDRLGRHEEADAVVQNMLAVDPLGITTLRVYGARLLEAGRYEEAHAVADTLTAQSKMYGYGLHIGASLYSQGHIAEGLYWSLKLGEETGYFYAFVWQALLLAGEYEEGRRLFDEADRYIAALEGRWDEVIELTQDGLQERAADEPSIALDAAQARYMARRFADALPLYELLLDSGDDGRLLHVPDTGPLTGPVMHLMQLAETRRRLGDENGAKEAAEIARRENTALRATKKRNNHNDIAAAMIAAFDGDQDAVNAAFRAAIDNGMRLPFWEQPIFDGFRDDPGMIALADALDAIRKLEHQKVLQLICFENPTPNAWRPMPETCVGATDQPGLLEFRR